jgi:hypothetical protein
MSQQSSEAPLVVVPALTERPGWKVFQDLSQFQSAGWVNVASQLIKYTGRSGSSGEGNLTGVPSSGLGAIVATIAAGNSVTSTPTITLSSGTIYEIADDDPIRPYVQRDNTTAQSDSATAEAGDNVGIHEHVIDEPDLTTIAQLNAIGDADLADFAYPVVTVRYQTRDIKTAVGKTVVINRTSQGWSGTFTITKVSISQIGVNDSLDPLFDVEASSVRITLENVLAKLLRGVN